MARTSVNDPLQKFKFRASVQGIPSSMGFSKISGLVKEVGVVEYDEGGYEYTHKLTGKAKYPEVTMEKGAFIGDTAMEDLVKNSLTNPDYRSTVVIDQYDKYGNIAKSWTLAEAWVSKWESAEFDATSEEVAIEKITIQFEYYL